MNASKSSNALDINEKLENKMPVTDETNGWKQQKIAKNSSQKVEDGLAQELDVQEKKGLIEAILFTSPLPLSINDLMQKVHIKRKELQDMLDALVDDYQERNSGVVLKEISLGYQFFSAPRYHLYLQKMNNQEQEKRLSKSSIETLAIICYEQPVTLPEIDKIRGASSRNALNKLLLYKLIQSKGKKDVPGKPTMYCTTRDVLDFLGIVSLNELPTLEDVKNINFDKI